MSFLLFCLCRTAWATARRPDPQSFPRRRAMLGNVAKSIFFQQVGKVMDPRLRGDDRCVAGCLFLLRRKICLLQWSPEQANRRGPRLGVTKFVSSGPFLGQLVSFDQMPEKALLTARLFTAIRFEVHREKRCALRAQGIEVQAGACPRKQETQPPSVWPDG